ncbi:MAG: preprotein translocase subunit SecA [Planctomycetota bacterium]|nr:preprotein translocase subunit SecA [Planctomycetota bacterium]
MEFLETLGDVFSSVVAWFERILRRFFGSANDRRIGRMGFVRQSDERVEVVTGSMLDRINSLEDEIQGRSDEQLKETAAKMRARYADGESLHDLMPEVFAAVREVGLRHLEMRHYDVQMIGGQILHEGMIAEMVTGEGKTLVATLPATLNAIAGKVHVITVNDYLARRDMEWMAPIYMGLGFTVGAIQSTMTPGERQPAYACDITYGTNNEFGFDYLRDNMKPTRDLQVQGPLDFAIVDEIDNILIDEARTPLIISGPAQDDVTKYARADRISRQLTRDEHFEVKEKEHSCHMTEAGIRAAEKLVGVESFYTTGNTEWPHLLDNSLKAHHLYKRNVNYVIEGGDVVIVDEFTGRKMPGRQWSDGLHQAVEAKEGVTIKEESQTLATITLQNYFKLYEKLAGMTGTAMTEAGEFLKIYQLDVLAVPTNKPLQRINHPDVIYRSESEKWEAVVEEVRRVQSESDQPLLIGTASIEKSEVISKKLERYGIDHNVLNAKNHEREAEIVAQAGRKGAVTISTNMAGRGTDIILGGNPEHQAWQELSKTYETRLDVPKSEWDQVTEQISKQGGMAEEGREIAEHGGLFVIGTERHDSRRIDLQLRGRAGRQGDPGSSRFFLSMEDDLMRLFIPEMAMRMIDRTMQDGEAIESRMVTKRIEGAQKKVEERHFESRKHLLDYDEVMDEQRKRVYAYRQQILDGVNCRELIMEMIAGQAERRIAEFLDTDYAWGVITEWAAGEFGIRIDVSEIRNASQEELAYILRDRASQQVREDVTDQIEECLVLDVDEDEWNWQALAQWANSRFNLGLNDKHLRAEPRENIFDLLVDRIEPVIDRYDYSILELFLEELFPLRSLCEWLRQQFTLDATPEQFAGLADGEVIETTCELLDHLYRDKEVQFPVTVGINNFMVSRQGGGEGSDREGLVQWASDRFNQPITLNDIANRQRDQIREALLEFSERAFDAGEKLKQEIDELCANNDDRANGTSHNTTAATDVTEITSWAESSFEITVEPDEWSDLEPDDVRQRLLSLYDMRFRPELGQAERSLILELLDTAWKDHLYHMDHLRSGIGLVGYAQKDPKTEYKKEGMRAFDQMWERIGEQATSSIFRIEVQSPEFVGSLWEISATSHADADSVYDAVEVEKSEGGGPQPGAEVEVIQPIRNTAPRVGRNDACPCGSGKKFKKCCGSPR